MKYLLYILFFLTFSSISAKGAYYKHAKKLANTNAIPLKDSIILFDTTKQAKTLSSETPKKISRIQGSMINWIGVLIDDPILWHKRMKSFSMHVTSKKQNYHDFEIEFYTLGSNGLPDKKLTSAPLAFRLYKKAWNEFEIPAPIEVPENGVILAFRYKKRETDWMHQVNSIGLGVYTTNKQSFLMHKSEWVEFPIYQPYQKKYSKKVSMMFKISTTH